MLFHSPTALCVRRDALRHVLAVSGRAGALSWKEWLSGVETSSPPLLQQPFALSLPPGASPGGKLGWDGVQVLQRPLPRLLVRTGLGFGFGFFYFLMD